MLNIAIGERMQEEKEAVGAWEMKRSGKVPGEETDIVVIVLLEASSAQLRLGVRLRVALLWLHHHQAHAQVEPDSNLRRYRMGLQPWIHGSRAYGHHLVFFYASALGTL